MKLIIDIPEEKELIDKAFWNDVSDFDTEDLAIIIKAVAYGTSLSEELEKIKAEIEDMGWDIYKTERKVPHKYVEKERIYELLDNHIKELKGENNDR